MTDDDFEEPVERPFEGLSPDLVVAAVEQATGGYSDGRVLALGSYENRVFQVGIEDGEPVVVKFYRPGRWTDESILEEHAFALELAAAEIPVVAPLVFDGQTLLTVESEAGATPDPDLANDDGWDDYAGPLDVDLVMERFSSAALGRIADEVCLQGHLLSRAYLIPVA